jgi:anti-sigma factor ChrR (cupin superfamily)
MDCSRYESQLALYAGGDLTGREAQELEGHLRVCPGCHELAEGLAQSQAALRRLGEDDVDEEALRQVRRRVMGEVGSRRPSWLYYTLGWRYGLAAGLAVLVAAIALTPRAPTTPSLPPPPIPVVELPLPVVAKPRPPARRPVVPVKPASAAQEPLVVKMFTDDPDVVIYWLIEQNGDSI